MLTQAGPCPVSAHKSHFDATSRSRPRSRIKADSKQDPFQYLYLRPLPFSLERLPPPSRRVRSFVRGFAIVYLLLITIVFLFAGMVMDIPVALTLLVPILAPAAIAQGINPVHLGIVLCFNLCIGLITPPLGGCLIVVSTVTGVGYWRLAAAILPFVAIEVVVLIALVLAPELTLVLPRAAGLSLN